MQPIGITDFENIMVQILKKGSYLDFFFFFLGLVCSVKDLFINCFELNVKFQIYITYL